jgi:hypothetical protein
MTTTNMNLVRKEADKAMAYITIGCILLITLCVIGCGILNIIMEG